MSSANSKHFSLPLAFKLLTSALQNPLQTPAICGFTMGFAADRIERALEECTSVAAKIDIVKSHPEFCRVGMKFLTTKQSPEEHIMMVARLQCRCNPRGKDFKRLHTPGRHRSDGQVETQSFIFVLDAAATAAHCITLALADLSQHRFRTGTTKGVQRWPQDAEDLLPNGLKDALVGLELWIAKPPSGYSIFTLMGSLALFHAPFALELFQVENQHRIFGRVGQHLEEALDFYDRGDHSYRAHFFDQPVQQIFSFFSQIMSADIRRSNWMFTIQGRLYIPVLQRLRKVLSTFPIEWSSIRATLTHITAWANADLDPKTGVAMVTFNRELMTELPHFNELENALKTMVETRMMGCLNISCQITSEAVHSQLCSKCNLIRYCGSTCQREAWKRDGFPHRPLCAKIYSLRTTLGEDWPSIWKPDMTYPRFHAICEARRVNLDEVKAIANEISALRLHKKITQEKSEIAAAKVPEGTITHEEQKIEARRRLEVLEKTLPKGSVTHITASDLYPMPNDSDAPA